MREKYNVDFFPAQLELSERYLRTLSAIKEEEVALPSKQDRREMSAWKGHDSPGAEYEGFEIHLYLMCFLTGNSGGGFLFFRLLDLEGNIALSDRN
jgi:hypothetical protein